MSGLEIFGAAVLWTGYLVITGLGLFFMSDSEDGGLVFALFWFLLWGFMGFMWLGGNLEWWPTQ